MQPSLVLKILEDRAPNQIQFFHKEANGKIVGAFFTDKCGEIIHPHKKIPVIFENIILPISPDLGSFYLPAKSKELSIRHKKQFLNFTYGVLNRRSICLVKDSFSKKTNKKRQSDMNKFLKMAEKSFPPPPLAASNSVQFTSNYLVCVGGVNIITAISQNLLNL